MKFKAARKDLLAALKTATSCSPNRPTIPVLANVVVNAEDDGKIKLTCCNLEQWVTVEFAGQVERKGLTTIPAKKLFSVLDALSGETVLLDCDVENHHTLVNCGSSKIKFLGLRPDDFPEMPKITEDKQIKITIESNDLRELVDHTTYAICANETRKVMTGMLFEASDNTLNAVGTDGKRLAVASVEYVIPLEKQFQRILPVSALNFMRGLKSEKIDLVFDENGKQLDVISDKIIFTSKLIEGNYPNYRQVVPAVFNHNAQIDTEVFLSKLNVISMIAGDDKYIHLRLGQDTLELTSESATSGRAEDSMAINLDVIDPVKITINSQMLFSAVKACAGDKFSIRFNDGLSPLKFEFDNGSFGVIMPVRK